MSCVSCGARVSAVLRMARAELFLIQFSHPLRGSDFFTIFAKSHTGIFIDIFPVKTYNYFSDGKPSSGEFLPDSGNFKTEG
jgi:hypothetical protein